MKTSFFSRAAICSFFLGIVTAFGIYIIIAQPNLSFTQNTDTSQVHVHADFLVYLDHERMRYTDDVYQSHSGDLKHPTLHLHSNDGHVIHRHADEVTLGDFFTSLGYTVTDTHITTDEGTTYRTDENHELILFVNGTPHDTFIDYIIADEDQLLIYYGAPDDERIHTYLETISDDACLYSGTCPERGIAPPTDCGLTCDV